MVSYFVVFIMIVSVNLRTSFIQLVSLFKCFSPNFLDKVHSFIVLVFILRFFFYVMLLEDILFINFHSISKHGDKARKKKAQG